MATHPVTGNQVTPTQALPGATLTLAGENFHLLPPSGTTVRIGGSAPAGDSMYCWMPATINGNQLTFQLPSDGNPNQVCTKSANPTLSTENMRLNDDGMLRPNVYNLTNLDMTYLPNYPTLDCGEDVRGVGMVWGTNIPGDPFPAPAQLEAYVKSDTVALLEWDYLTGNGGYDIDGYRVYEHRCIDSFGQCDWWTVEPWDYETDDRKDGAFFWREATCDWSQTTPQQFAQGGPCPSEDLIRPLPAAQRGEPLVHSLGVDPASFAGSVEFIGFTAWKRGVGESPLRIERIDFGDDYGCEARIQPARGRLPGAEVEVTYFTGEQRPGSNLTKLTPFPHDTAGAPVEYEAEVRGLYDAWQYPIVEHDPVPSPGPLPYFHKPRGGDNPAMQLQRGRGYASDANTGRLANVIVDGRFWGGAFYATAHLRVNPANPTATGVQPVAFLAGMAEEFTDWTIGMVHENTNNIQVQITDLVLPNRENPGRIAGTVKSKVWTVIPKSGNLPGEWPSDAGSASWDTTMDYFENDVELRFDVPLHDDRCW